uniref:Carboxypeptidase B n=1 Tax=Phallusia mammillata TaxID=59560 RepID=A0A6F9D9S0_9ASCI|nr:carboxypeptidase B [Phallusia mammillata]
MLLWSVCLIVLQVIFACSGDQVIRITSKSKQDAKKIDSLLKSRLGLEVWKSAHPFDMFTTDAEISSDQIQVVKSYLEENKIEHRTTISDVKKLIQSQMNIGKHTKALPNSLADFNYSVYHPANEIENWMDLAVNQFDYVTKLQVGVSYQGRPIHGLKISKQSNVTVVKPAVYIDSLIHSREWVAGGATVFTFKEILLNPVYSWMVDDLDWYFIPIVNPDGYVFTWSDPDNRLWRKTLSGGNARCVGADGNRNYDDHWGGEGGSQEPCSSLFYGTHAESESEVRHLARFITAHNDSIKAVVNVHSYAQVILFPYNYKLGEYPPNVEEQNQTASQMSKAMYKVHGMKYNFGSGAEAMYVSTGISTDWSQAAAGIDINFTIELRDTGEYGFLLPENQIVPTGEEFLAGIEVLARHVKDKWA